MQEIRLWTLDSNSDGNLIAVSMDTMAHAESENQLEELLVSSPDILMPGLRLVGRQTPTEGGPLDLLGIDEDGRLVVFELKRGTLSRESVAQIIDYASYLSSIAPESLAQHISERSGTGGIEKIDDFDSWYQEAFPNSPDSYSAPPRMVLVGLGADDRTQRMTSYLAQSGVNISLLTFHAFQKEDKVFLAKQVNVEAPEEHAGAPTKYTKSSNLEALRLLAEKCAVKPLLESMASFFRTELPAYEWPSRSSYSYSLIERTERGTPSYRVYISIYVHERRPRQLQLVFQRRAVELAPHAFERLQEELAGRFLESSGNLETWIKSLDEWESLKESFKPVLVTIVDGWKAKTQEESGNSEKIA